MMRSSLKTLALTTATLVVAALAADPGLRAQVRAGAAEFTVLTITLTALRGVDTFDGEEGPVLVVTGDAEGNAAASIHLLDNGASSGAAIAIAGADGAVSVRDSGCMGGFDAGDVFSGNGRPGQIARRAADGDVVQNPWVTLADEAYPVQGAIYQDRGCAFGGDLIVATAGGNVWRVTAEGAATRVAALGTSISSVITMPNDAATYGPIAGRILAGDANGSGRLTAIDASGHIVTVGDGGDFVTAPVHASVLALVARARTDMPGDADFVGVDAATGQLVAVAADSLGCQCGQLLIGSAQGGDGSGLQALRWTGSGFELTTIAAASARQAPRWTAGTVRGGVSCRACAGTIGNIVWSDQNSDGVRDEGEPLRAGITVTLSRPDTPSYRQVAVTDGNGRYHFSGLCAGEYVVSINVPGNEGVVTAARRTGDAIGRTKNVAVIFKTDGDSEVVDYGLTPAVPEP